MKLSLVQMTSGTDVAANVELACKNIDIAVERDGADLVVLPEFFNNYYFAQYRDKLHFDLAEPIDGFSLTRVREHAREREVHVVATIYEEAAPGQYYDTAVLIDSEGAIVGLYRKTHPSAVRSLEKLYFRYGSHYPVFRVGDWRVGIAICYDNSFPESVRVLALNGAELVVIPYAAPEQRLWRDVMRTRAWDNGVYLAPCNKVGVEGIGTDEDWRFRGQSMIVDPLGDVLAEFDEFQDGILSAELDRDHVFQTRKRYPMFRDRRPDLYRSICTPTEDLLH